MLKTKEQGTDRPSEGSGRNHEKEAQKEHKGKHMQTQLEEKLCNIKPVPNSGYLD